MSLVCREAHILKNSYLTNIFVFKMFFLDSLLKVIAEEEVSMVFSIRFLIIEKSCYLLKFSKI